MDFGKNPNEMSPLVQRPENGLMYEFVSSLDDHAFSRAAVRDSKSRVHAQVLRIQHQESRGGWI